MQTPLQIFMPWVHVFSFSVWLGANLLVLGMLRLTVRELPSGERAGFARRLAERLNRVVAAAAPLAVLSGLGGFLSVGAVAPPGAGSGWLFVLTAKGALTAMMVLNHGLQAYRYDVSPGEPLDGRNPWMRLLTANGILGIIVLLLGLALRRAAV